MPSGRRSSKRPWSAENAELDLERIRGGRRTEDDGDGAWTVQAVPGSGTKTYRCPGCHQEIGPGTPHLVTWQADALLGAQAGLELRRHWHTGCWQHRDRRR